MIKDSDILIVNTVEDYNRFFGFETRHPQIGIVRFDSTVPQPQAHRMMLGIYALFLKKTRGCTINYGKTRYDFDEQTIVSFAPGQFIDIHSVDNGPAPEAVGLLFHPDFLHRTSLGRNIRQYSFFSYASNEALHLSAEESRIMEENMDKVIRELEHPIDKFTKSLIISYIEVILNYCMRFYERQFVTREEMNHDALARFESLLDDYLYFGKASEEGVPTVKYLADKICLSPNYFGDMVKQITGKTALEYIQLKMLTAAKERLLDPACNIKQISEYLGFRYPQHFVRFFKRQEGCTPKEFRENYTKNRDLQKDFFQITPAERPDCPEG